MRERRAAAWRHLNVVERDVLIVVTALCKVCSLLIFVARICSFQYTVTAL